MTIKITFKHYPRAGKFTRGRKYYVTEGGKDRRLPKFLWDRL